MAHLFFLFSMQLSDLTLNPSPASSARQLAGTFSKRRREMDENLFEGGQAFVFY
jgi:hypothetical protein